jgi:hypothetical protein
MQLTSTLYQRIDHQAPTLYHRVDQKAENEGVSQPANSVQPAEKSQIMVKVPTGAKPGDSIQATSPDGQTLQFELPAEASVGQLVPVLYTPLHPQPAPVAATVVSAPEQPVMMESLSDSVSNAEFQRAAMSSENDAMATAMMQNAAVKNVMQDYTLMSSFHEDNIPQMTAYLRAQDIQKRADWETASNLAAAQAEADAVNFNAWKRSEALQTAAMAKQQLAEEGADYSLVKANTIHQTGTDAAWKSAGTNGQQMPAPVQQTNELYGAQQMPAMPAQQMPAMPTPVQPVFGNGQQMPAPAQQVYGPYSEKLPSTGMELPAVRQAAPESINPTAPAVLESSSSIKELIGDSDEADVNLLSQASQPVMQSLAAPQIPQQSVPPSLQHAPPHLHKQVREDALDLQARPTLQELQQMAEKQSVEGPPRQSVLQLNAATSQLNMAAARNHFLPELEQPVQLLSGNVVFHSMGERASEVATLVSPEMLQDAKKTIDLENLAANAARAEVEGYQSMYGQDRVSPAAWAASEEQKRRSEWRAAADLEAVNAVKQVAFDRSEKRASALKAAASAKLDRAFKAAEFTAASASAGNLVGYDAERVLGKPVIGSPANAVLLSGVPAVPGVVSPAEAQSVVMLQKNQQTSYLGALKTRLQSVRNYFHISSDTSFRSAASTMGSIALIPLVVCCVSCIGCICWCHYCVGADTA